MATKRRRLPAWEKPEVGEGVLFSEHELYLEEERTRNIILAISLLEKNTRDYCVAFVDPKGAFRYEASSATYGLGAAARMELELRDFVQRDIDGR